LRVTYGFPGAEENIGDELSASRRDGPADGLVLGGVLTSGSSVDILEDLVETEFTEALSGVTDQGRKPAESETLEAFSGLDLGETVADRLVETGVSLFAEKMVNMWTRQSIIFADLIDPILTCILHLTISRGQTMV
jgi:hypothetical protein